MRIWNWNTCLRRLRGPLHILCFFCRGFKTETPLACTCEFLQWSSLFMLNLHKFAAIAWKHPGIEETNRNDKIFTTDGQLYRAWELPVLSTDHIWLLRATFLILALLSAAAGTLYYYYHRNEKVKAKVDATCKISQNKSCWVDKSFYEISLLTLLAVSCQYWGFGCSCEASRSLELDESHLL